MNWATGARPKTGRPIENPEARFDKTGKGMFVMPSAQGGHNWEPMAYDPRQKLVFIPGPAFGISLCAGQELEAGQDRLQHWHRSLAFAADPAVRCRGPR